MQKDRTLSFAFKSSLPVLAGYVVLGIGFGILLDKAGYNALWALGTSLFIYAGSMQFVTINLLSQQASLLTAALMTLAVNLRHIFYGLSMLDDYKETGKSKPYLIHTLTDETFSLVCRPDLPADINKHKYFLAVSIFDQIYWVTGSVIGNLLGQIIPFSTDGIDFAMTSLFVVMLTEQWEKNKNHIPALTGIIASIVCILVFGSESFLIPAMGIITLALFMEKNYV